MGILCPKIASLLLFTLTWVVAVVAAVVLDVVSVLQTLSWWSS